MPEKIRIESRGLAFAYGLAELRLAGWLVERGGNGERGNTYRHIHMVAAVACVRIKCRGLHRSRPDTGS
jgi:hypothetical protein